jgi:putative component of membrane protein insertase Oxa1/YidC/SpoIIIJ protein YidD
MKKALFILLFSTTIFAQHDWQRWSAAEVNYEVLSTKGKSYEIDNSNISMLLMSGLKNAYYFLISDLDGDNCPFYPSCSTFFVESVKITNIFQGALMFSDRFTRDMNLFKDPQQYQVHSSGKFFDPAENYSFNPSKFILFSGNEKF